MGDEYARVFKKRSRETKLGSSPVVPLVKKATAGKKKKKAKANKKPGEPDHEQIVQTGLISDMELPAPPDCVSVSDMEEPVLDGLPGNDSDSAKATSPDDIASLEKSITHSKRRAKKEDWQTYISANEVSQTN